MTCDPDSPAPPADIWSRARADYLSGESAPVVAERYGLSTRTLRRRAASEGWRRADQPASNFEEPLWHARAVTRDEAIELYPGLAEVEQAAVHDQIQLLMDPEPAHLRRFAFRKAAEAAAMSRPAEAVVWMRLVQCIDRTGDRIVSEEQPFPEQDYLRAAVLDSLAKAAGGPAPAAD